ncbi:MAG: transketolase, partial [Firmicutes bacterium]|nr:transketolase [Bacillota bacterium]
MDKKQLQEKARQIRLDAVEMIAKAGSGHPGGSLSATDIMVALYYSKMALYEDPADERRDRFVLSGGHGSTLEYALLHLAGVKGAEMDQCQSFRQLGSRCAG